MPNMSGSTMHSSRTRLMGQEWEGYAHKTIDYLPEACYSDDTLPDATCCDECATVTTLYHIITFCYSSHTLLTMYPFCDTLPITHHERFKQIHTPWAMALSQVIITTNLHCIGPGFLIGTGGTTP